MDSTTAVSSTREPVVEMIRRMAFNDLLDLQNVLDVQLVFGSMSMSDWEKEWAAVLGASGWTRSQYEVEIDRRWDHIDVPAAPPKRPNSKN